MGFCYFMTSVLHFSYYNTVLTNLMHVVVMTKYFIIFTI